MDVQPPEVATRSTGKILGDVYNVNVGWLFPTVSLCKLGPVRVLCLLIQRQLRYLAERNVGYVPEMTTLCRDVSVCWSVPWNIGGKCGIGCSHSLVGRISLISVRANWSCWSVAAAGEKAAFSWALHPLLPWITISLLARACSWDLAVLRTRITSEWLQEKYGCIYLHEHANGTENNVQCRCNRSLQDISASKQ